MTDRWLIHHADVLDALHAMESDSFDAILSDVPYGLGSRQPTPQEICDYVLGNAGLEMGGDFMSKEWEIPSVAVWKELLRVVKPGAPVLSFAGSRTCDLISIGMRAAGFELRDTQIHWQYATGFPKNFCISKAIDAKNGDERPVHGTERRLNSPSGIVSAGRDAVEIERKLTSAASAASAASAPWSGHGTALKPAYEPCVVAMKPVDGTFAENALTHGVAGLNIDATRVGYANEGDMAAAAAAAAQRLIQQNHGAGVGNYGLHGTNAVGSVDAFLSEQALGRWPANVTFGHLPGCVRVGSRKVKAAPPWNDNRGPSSFTSAETSPIRHADDDGTETVESWKCEEGCPVAALDAQSGDRKSGGVTHQPNRSGYRGGLSAGTHVQREADNGGASRFFSNFRWLPGEASEHGAPDSPRSSPFFCAKASRFERDFGCELLPAKTAGEATDREDGSAGLTPRAGAGRTGGARNHHPCVKPLTLTQYLATLALCPPRADGKPRRILVPYAGSGSEMIGALRAGWEEMVGIERDAEYLPILRARIERWLSVPAHLLVEEVLAAAEKPIVGQGSLFGKVAGR